MWILQRRVMAEGLEIVDSALIAGLLKAVCGLKCTRPLPSDFTIPAALYPGAGSCFVAVASRSVDALVVSHATLMGCNPFVTSGLRVLV